MAEPNELWAMAMGQELAEAASYDPTKLTGGGDA